jgi:hypothetical protein
MTAVETPIVEDGGMLTLHPKFIDGKQMTWNAHDLDTLMRCPRLYRLKILEGWRSKAFGAATSWGRAVHYSVEVFDTHVFAGASREDALDAALVALVKEYGEELSESDDTARNLESAIRATVWRADAFYDNQLKTATMPDDKPALEVEFEVPIPGLDGHRFRGRIDRIGEMDGALYLIDLKTTKSQLTRRFFNYYFPNNQIMAYLWVARKILELPIAGFIIDAVQTGVNFTRFGRHLVSVTPAQINEWERSMITAIQSTIAYDEGEHYPVNFASCGNMGGCMFIDVCSVPPAQRLGQLEDGFNLEPHREMDITYDVTEYEV